ncbi:ABC-2 type transporter [Neobacillus vireti LMG 21834]|uniref:ABC-2 type transporter n=1 Tax=Neobacillus vireti LMG 21834 TaxID=1131730 RepID=A0AB94IL19_9BACI|nr:ABC transporter permease [Neobacillus vireti]ETI67693.1 ABC-2 type transporter [Neobacillus vireti LMG 21834]
MRKIWTILILHLMAFFKSPGVLVLMFVMPVLFSGIFGGMTMNSEQNKPIVNVVLSDTENSGQILNLLAKDQHYEWKKATRQEAEKNVAAQDVAAAVVIPDDIGERISASKPLLDIIVQRKNESYLALSAHLEGTAGLVLRSYQATSKLDSDAFPKVLETITNNKGVTVEKQTIQKDKQTNVEANLMFVGFAMMFMMFGLSGAASTILEERMGGTWGRLMVSPASKLQIILGYLLAYFFMGWIQFAILMTTMNLMFATTWGNLTYLIPFASLVILSVVGFGLMIAGLVKTKQQASAISAVLIVSTCMLGGVYWPIDIVPELMQKIALGVPQSWAMSGFKEIISGSLHSATLMKDTLALVGFSAIFFFIGLRGIKFE